ncbi:MAG: DUF58 domain-containing protein [Bacteroidota bacterium]
MSIQLDNSLLFSIGSLELLARQAVEGFITGLHKSPYHGFSVEFSEHRAYNSGESTRFIDWKLFGRTDKLYVKRFEEETNLRCQLIIDVSSSMYFPIADKITPEHLNKIAFSAIAAASIMLLQRKQRDATGLTIFADTIEQHFQARSTPQHYKLILAQLEQLLQPYNKEKKKETQIATSLHAIAENIHKRSLVIIFSDMMDNIEKTNEIFSALQHLRHNKHEVILFHVKDENLEYKLDFGNRMHKFIDMESGDEIKLNPTEIKKRYITNIAEFKKEIKLRCNQYHIDFVDADINQGYRQILLPWLLKRQSLY